MPRSVNKAFTLLEMTIVLILFTVITSVAIPNLTQAFLNKAEAKTSLDINAIQDAALAYYVKNSAWPTSIIPAGTTPGTDLESNGFLPPGWGAMNPFGNAYTVSSNGSLFTVSSEVANGTQTSIMSQLPTSSFSGNVVSSSVPVPGVTASGFGQWQPISFDQIYQAPTDGYIEGSFLLQAGISGQQTSCAQYTTANNASLSNPEASIPIQNHVNPGQTTYGIFPINFTVRKGDYYELALTCGPASGEVLYYMPS